MLGQVQTRPAVTTCPAHILLTVGGICSQVPEGSTEQAKLQLPPLGALLLPPYGIQESEAKVTHAGVEGDMEAVFDIVEPGAEHLGNFRMGWGGGGTPESRGQCPSKLSGCSRGPGKGGTRLIVSILLVIPLGASLVGFHLGLS